MKTDRSRVVDPFDILCPDFDENKSHDVKHDQREITDPPDKNLIGQIINEFKERRIA